MLIYQKINKYLNEVLLKNYNNDKKKTYQYLSVDEINK